MMPFNNADGRKAPGAVFGKVIYSSKIKSYSKLWRQKTKVQYEGIVHESSQILEASRQVDMFSWNTSRIQQFQLFQQPQIFMKQINSLACMQLQKNLLELDKPIQFWCIHAMNFLHYFYDPV